MDPKKVTRELEALRNAFDNTLPEDNAADCRENFDHAAFEDLYDKLVSCLELTREAAPWNRKQFEWYDTEACADHLFDKLTKDFIPRLNRVIEETLPVPEATADRAMALDSSIRMVSPIAVRLFNLLAVETKSLTGRAAPPTWRDDLSRRLSALVHTYQAQINAILTSPDPPDLRNLASDLLRMDVLYWLLEELKIPEVAKVLAANEKVTARLTMDSASEAIEKFLDRPDNLNRFDLAVVITAIDDLIAVMARVLEHHERDMESPHDGFLEARGRESITRFVSVMGKLMIMMFRDLSENIKSGNLVYETFEINVAKIERIYEFCQLADPLTNGRVHAAAERTIRERSKLLVSELEELVTVQPSADIVKSLKRLEAALKNLAPVVAS